MDSAITWWIGIMAVATVIQAATVVAAAILLSRTASRAEHMLNYVEREVPPLLEHVSKLVAHADDLTDRLSRAEVAAEQTAERVADGLVRARRWALTRVWPVLGALSAVKAVASALRSHKGRARPSGDALAEARFVYEGGGQTRDVS